jgi:hypothetical protein
MNTSSGQVADKSMPKGVEVSDTIFTVFVL